MSSGAEPIILWGGIALLTGAFVLWGLFEKAGRPGWFALVPVLNGFILMDLIGRPRSWTWAALVPGLNLYVLFRISQDLARSFGKTARFGTALFLFGPLLGPLLAFGSATYVGPAASWRGTTPVRT